MHKNKKKGTGIEPRHLADKLRNLTLCKEGEKSERAVPEPFAASSLPKSFVSLLATRHKKRAKYDFLFCFLREVFYFYVLFFILYIFFLDLRFCSQLLLLKAKCQFCDWMAFVFFDALSMATTAAG